MSRGLFPTFSTLNFVIILLLFFKALKLEDNLLPSINTPLQTVIVSKDLQFTS